MNNYYRNIFIFFLAALCVSAVIISFNIAGSEEHPRIKIRSSSSPHASVQMKAQRLEYFIQLLRDPATGKIPDYIRQRELAYAKKLNLTAKSLQKTSAFTWNEAGPYDVGGRTRALAVDVTNPNTILAGGASGGIWKSTDNGESWVLKSGTSNILSVTTIAQDPRPGFTNIWYYASGEYMGGSGEDLGSTARFTGDGVYKSTDNGESWQVLPSTLSANPTGWESYFDYVLKMVVSPVNGNIFLVANAIGIYRSTDGGNSFTLVLGGINHHIYSDISVASNGNLAAVLSRASGSITTDNEPGIYKSTDNGNNWTNITPANYPAASMRSLIQIAPSNPNTAYVLTYTGAVVDDKEEIKFYKINVANGASDDRSNNLPDYSSLGGQVADNALIYTQYNYNMVLAVKPDDENFVIVGGTSLFRSMDGFAVKPALSSSKTVWIGGYHREEFFYPGFHPDVHSFSFDPTDPNKMWWGHDGGLSYTTDIRNTTYSQFFPWKNKNNGYNVTQFYHISISPNAGDNRIIGGTQDNGSPFFRYTGTEASSEDISSGDGAFSYIGKNFAYTSSQNGTVIRLRYDQQGSPAFENGWGNITPSDADGQSFINPFCVDPNNENVMYYPAGNSLWRNNTLGSIPDYQNQTTIGWTKLNSFTVPSGYSISALTVSTTPASILYYGASGDQAPKIYKVTGAATATNGAVDISIPGVPEGAYVHNIAVNPDDADEIIAVFSNYNIIGLYHSTNGGQSYTAIEGNLQGDTENPGPSLRSASILPSDDGTTYFIATSIGLFSTSHLDGNNTTWTQEGANVLGNVIVDHVVSRKSDGLIVAGTHGRGAFVGTSDGSGSAVLSVNTDPLNINVLPGDKSTQQITITNNGNAALTFSVSAASGDGLLKLNTGTIKIFSKPVKSSLKSGTGNIQSIPSGKTILPGKTNKSKPASVNADDVIIMDDGNETADEFIGWEEGGVFTWVNEFSVDNDFTLNGFNFFSSSESALTNSYNLTVTNSTLEVLAQGTLTFANSAEGSWNSVNLTEGLNFYSGEFFYIVVQSNGLANFPAGVDFDGAVTGRGYYLDGTEFVNLNTVTGFENGAFLIRAVGTFNGNLQPIAVAQVTPNPADINEPVSFDRCSGSSSASGITPNSRDSERRPGAAPWLCCD
ncbi:MAG: sialidase family protein [Ignavibacteriaceae bacterium]